MFFRRVIHRTVRRAAGAGQSGAACEVETGRGSNGMAVHSRFGGGSSGLASMEASVHTPTRLVASEHGLTNTQTPDGYEYGGTQPGDAAVVVVAPSTRGGARY